MMMGPINSYAVEMTILQGRNLAAKDRHILTRQRTTSDPYIEVFLGMDRRLGRTPTVHKTVNPVWNSKFHFSIPNKRHAVVPSDMSTFLQHGGGRNNNNNNNNNNNASAASSNDNASAPPSMMEACGMVLLKMYDQDQMTDDDMMGTLVVPIPVPPKRTFGRNPSTISNQRRWYQVDNLFVPNAVGQVEIELSVKPEMGTFSPRDLLPSPETFARWTQSCVGGGKQQPAVDEHNVVIESDPNDRKNYILAVFKQFAS